MSKIDTSKIDVASEFDDTPITQELDSTTVALANVSYHVGCAIDELNSARRAVKETDHEGIRLIERAQDAVIRVMERFTSIRDQNRN